MKRKLVFLPTIYSKEIVDKINEYFDMGYDIEKIFNADVGSYLFLVLKGNDSYTYTFARKFDSPEDKCELIEEKYRCGENWCSTNTQDIKPN